MNDDKDETKGLALGAVDYITKPINPAIVVQRIQTQLELLDTRRKLENLNRHYSSYLSPQLVEGIRTGCINALVSTHRKKITVFFSDIEGFTEISDLLSPEDMTFALNYYFDTMSHIVITHRGTLDKYIGDAVMVFFGDPESQGLKEDAIACISMGLEMLRAIPQVEAAWKEHGIQKSLRIRIGIATGFCTVGNFGSSSQLTYTILGTTVNLASRIESTGVAGSVVVSEETEYLVRDRFCCIPRTPLTIKGVSHPVNSWEIIDDVQ
jgi:class 3 adenylate cyclase